MTWTMKSMEKGKATKESRTHEKLMENRKGWEGCGTD